LPYPIDVPRSVITYVGSTKGRGLVEDYPAVSSAFTYSSQHG